MSPIPANSSQKDGRIKQYVEGGIPMSLRLVGLHFESEDVVIAELDSGPPTGRVIAKFEVDRSGEIVSANSDPDVFAKFATSMKEVRRVAAAVIAFARASGEMHR